MNEMEAPIDGRSGGRTSIEALRTEALTCLRCPLATSRRNVVFDDGDATADLMILGEAPGEEEDAGGRPFVGRAGRVLDGLLEGINLTRSSVWVANVVMCRPPNNRPPRVRDEIAACSKYLDDQIALVEPRVILALGATATRRLLGRGTLSGRLDTRPKVGQVMVVPTYHPAALNRANGRWGQVREDFEAARTRLAK